MCRKHTALNAAAPETGLVNQSMLNPHSSIVLRILVKSSPNTHHQRGIFLAHAPSKKRTPQDLTWYAANSAFSLLACSSSSSFPVGRSTLAISFSAAAGCVNTHRLKVSSTVSKEASGNGREVTSACRVFQYDESCRVRSEFRVVGVSDRSESSAECNNSEGSTGIHPSVHSV